MNSGNQTLLSLIKKASKKRLFLLVSWMPDKLYIKITFILKMGCRVNLKNPTTFNDKMQWLKLYAFKKEYSDMVDKYEAKKLVSQKYGSQYVVPLLGVWDKFEDIDFKKLPDQFVLKCTHDSGGLVICRDKSKLDIDEAKKRINNSLRTNYYYFEREKPYKYIKPRIIAEEYVTDRQEKDYQDYRSLIVYKVMTFNGKPKLIQTIQNDKQEDESIDYFDTDWNLMPFRQNYPNSSNHLPKPASLDMMLKMATELACGFPFLRVDFYEIDKKPVFSEFTFYSDGGYATFTPKNWDQILGSWLELPQTDKSR